MNPLDPPALTPLTAHKFVFPYVLYQNIWKDLRCGRISAGVELQVMRHGANIFGVFAYQEVRQRSWRGSTGKERRALLVRSCLWMAPWNLQNGQVQILIRSLSSLDIFTDILTTHSTFILLFYMNTNLIYLLRSSKIFFRSFFGYIWDSKRTIENSQKMSFSNNDPKDHIHDSYGGRGFFKIYFPNLVFFELLTHVYICCVDQ